MTAAAGGGMPHYLTFDDNGLAAALYGDRDRHLARIEQQLGVSVTPRGNRVALEGPSAAAAAGVLNHLYGRLKSGLRVGPADVDAALRLADGAAAYTRALGLELDLTGVAFGMRGKRFSLLVEDGVVRRFNIDEEGLGSSSAETMLEQLA